jgi:hypothetical protein
MAGQVPSSSSAAIISAMPPPLSVTTYMVAAVAAPVSQNLRPVVAQQEYVSLAARSCGNASLLHVLVVRLQRSWCRPRPEVRVDIPPRIIALHGCAAPPRWIRDTDRDANGRCAGVHDCCGRQNLTPAAPHHRCVHVADIQQALLR